MSLIRSRPAFVSSLAMLLLLLFTEGAWAQERTPADIDFQRAVQLIRANRMPEALPILEKLYADNPDNPAVLEAFGYALSVTALADNSDADKRKEALIRARGMIEKAQKLGNNSDLVRVLLERIPPDGNMPDIRMAQDPEAEEALRSGEDAFSKGDMEGAIKEYERAFRLEPTLYEAPLFIGDAYFKLGKTDLAGENYAKAIAIDPDRDTAYRYWGDALLSANRPEEAKEKFVEAVIAEPYSPDPWRFLDRWAQRAGIRLAHPRIEVPRSSVAADANNTINIQITPGKDKEDGSEAWISYSLVKAAWLGDEKLFKEAYPRESKYRHSLREEVSSLELVAETVQNRLKEGELQEKELDISIANLLKVQRAGLLEAFVLFAMADEGISQDYTEYRKANRDKLRQYLNEFVTSAK